ncbi:MAG: hypothetical protein JWO05_1134 [Gemmatimonadetes bacterium]|nr:hypothetical protein [Gemmatimonadota bacterium]
MTVASLLERQRVRLAQRLHRRVETVDAVFDDDLWKILAEFDLLGPLDRGELRCYYTGIPLSRDNVSGVVGTPNGPQLFVEVGTPPRAAVG